MMTIAIRLLITCPFISVLITSSLPAFRYCRAAAMIVKIAKRATTASSILARVRNNGRISVPIGVNGLQYTYF